MNLYVFQSRFPISQDIQKKVSDILHNTFQRHTGYSGGLSAMLRESGFPDSKDYDYIIKRTGGSCLAIERLEVFSENCRRELSELLNTREDRILFRFDKH